MPAPRFHEQGFTLIELLVALTIFAVGMLGIAGMQITSISQNSGANTRSIAVTLGQGVLEEILTWSESDARFATAATENVWDLDPATAATTRNFPGGGTYSALWSVTPDTPVNGISRIVVTVTGPLESPSDSPRRRSVTLTDFKRVAL